MVSAAGTFSLTATELGSSRWSSLALSPSKAQAAVATSEMNGKRRAERGIKKCGRHPLPPPPKANPATNCVQQVADEVLELNRELVAQNIWLREQLTADIDKNKDADDELKLENERLRQHVLELESKLKKKKEIALLSAKIVDTRTTYRNNQQFVEYKVQLETDVRGTLFVWYRYSTFRRLAATFKTKQRHSKNIPELPRKQVFGNFSRRVIHERVEKLNQFLDAATNSDNLQWGICVNSDTYVYKRRKRPIVQPTSSLKTKDWTLLSRKNGLHAYAVVVSATIVGNRIIPQEEGPIIEHLLSVRTNATNMLLVWHRYSAVYDWVESMQQESSCLKLPHLPKEEPYGSFSDHIQHQTVVLDALFTKFVESKNLQLIVRVDGDTFVSKVRVEDPVLTPREQNLETTNPLSASVSKLFPLKSIMQRQRRHSDTNLDDHKRFSCVILSGS